MQQQQTCSVAFVGCLRAQSVSFRGLKKTPVHNSVLTHQENMLPYTEEQFVFPSAPTVALHHPHLLNACNAPPAVHNLILYLRRRFCSGIAPICFLMTPRCYITELIYEFSTSLPAGSETQLFAFFCIVRKQRVSIFQQSNASYRIKSC